MKKILALSLVLAFVSSFALASTGNDSEEADTKNYVEKKSLKGPNAKNYHPHKYDIITVETKTVDVDHVVKSLQGPKAKNYHPTDFEISHDNLNDIESNDARKNLKGPKAKNYKPGR